MTISNVPCSAEILKQKFTQSLGLPFESILPKSRIEEAMKELSITHKKRVFDPIVTLWAFLSQILDVDKSCHNVVSRVIAWLSPHNVEIPSSDTSGYCQARKRLPIKLIQKLFGESGENLESEALPEQLWCGRHVKIVDGSTVSMPDTQENQEAYPQSGKQQPGCGFPIAKIGALFSLATGALMGGVIDVLKTNDIKLARQLYKFLKIGDILLGDSAFHSYADFYWLTGRDCDAVIRENKARLANFKTITNINESDRLVIWHKPKRQARGLTLEEFNSLPPYLTVRVISYRVDVPGFRTEKVTLITTLLDAKLYPTHAIKQLYRNRWDVELDLRHLKTTLGMDILRCKTPDLVHKEIYIYFLAYNLLRGLMLKAGNTYGVAPTQLSVQSTRHHLNNFVNQFIFVDDKLRQQLYSTLLKVIVHKSLPQRPNRIEPRVVKRRAKAYPKMQSPRVVLRKKMVAA